MAATTLNPTPSQRPHTLKAPTPLLPPRSKSSIMRPKPKVHSPKSNPTTTTHSTHRYINTPYHSKQGNIKPRSCNKTGNLLTSKKRNTTEPYRQIHGRHLTPKLDATQYHATTQTKLHVSLCLSPHYASITTHLHSTTETRN
ncbi:hypothetical protein M758_9G164200 [Ceratodon purpureus]|nr:hypothetical protein M758_9G164200 [Ceratodon purpureus]